MRSNNILNAIVKTAALAGVLLASGASYAADVYLETEAYSKDILKYAPDYDPMTGLPAPAVLESVPMWRFVCAATASVPASACDDTTSDSAQIHVPAGDTLNIYLTNNLPEKVSIVIPGQVEDGAGNPVMVGGRVQSFTKETVGSGGTQTYTWSGVRPGTYLYQSGTHPSIHVPMGLFGALVVDTPTTTVVCAAGQPAYDDADSCYTHDKVLLFSEIDPVQNEAVSAAGGAVGSYPSTINYSPTYLLVNGEVSPDLNDIGDGTGAVPEATSILLRLLNAGSRTHTPAIVGLDMQLVAEDGNLYPGLPVMGSQALLPAGKTVDAIVSAPAENVTFALYDRTPDFTNAALPEGGMIANINANAGSPAIAVDDQAMDDAYSVVEDTAFTASPGVLDNDDAALTAATLVTGPSNGTLTCGLADGICSNGTFTYTPSLNFSGTDGFTYTATGGGITDGAAVTLSVSFVNDAPEAAADGPYVNTVGNIVTADILHSVLANDADPDGDDLTAVIEGSAPTGLILNPDGTFTYTGGVATSFMYRADDGTTQSAPVEVQLDYLAPSGIALTVKDPTGYVLTDYRWLVQEDTTYRIDPANPTSTPVTDQLALNFHKSSMPVVAQGCSNCTPDVDNEPTGNFPGPEDIDVDGDAVLDNAIPFNELALDRGDINVEPLAGFPGAGDLDQNGNGIFEPKHYYVSVLPNDAGTGVGHTIGGAQIAPNQTAVEVLVQKQEIPEAQISVYTFEDGAPTNGVPDAGEAPLGGFQIVLEDAGGRYGISGGTMSQDAFGEPLTNALPCAPPATPGVILTCADGNALIKHLPPGKYGVIAVAPAGPDQWIQTSTIEGTKVIDAWVKAGEPQFFVEFGAPGPHAFIGFVNPDHTCVGDAPCQVATPTPPAPPCCSSVTGHVTLAHDPRPPGVPGTVDSGSYVGLSHTRAWIGLNTIAGDGPSIRTVQADADGNFTMDGIPDGTYQLVIWDTYLDQVISFQTVTLPADAGDIGNIAVPEWFARTEHNVFLDDGAGNPANAGNGIRDAGEVGLPEQAVNLRWRDGTVNQSFPTDLDGFVPFDQTFPFFSWQTLEVDYTRMKPTGVTVWVDAGGDVSGGPFPGLMNPQTQLEDCTDASCESRTEQGSTVLVQAFQGFPGQTSIFDWGKMPYEPGENGGISGIVFYGSTRGEENPRLTVGDPWEPGIANVTVRLYKEIARNPDDVDIDVEPTGDFPGPGDTDHNSNGFFDGPTTLTLVDEVKTDSWDESKPDTCPGEDSTSPFATDTLGLANIDRCYDGWRNWNQVRPGVFDGGYAFNDIPPGNYVVEVVPPFGYELIKEQDMNVGFGDSFGPNNTYDPVSVTLPNGMLALVLPDQAMIADAMGPEPGIAQPPCVGLYHTVPDELSLFPGFDAPYKGASRPLCNRKRVVLSDQGQAASDFHLFTSTPVAVQYAGLITDDISNETDPRSPGFGEKWSPAFLPFAIRDFTGHEVYRGHGDAFGRYNGMGPSTLTANAPIPSGYSPAMMLACLNDPGDANDDPLRLGSYGVPCYTAQFMPGTTTYLDTPILPTAAFAAGFNPVDCAAPTRTPTIASVKGPGGVGPLVPASGGDLIITSHGMTTIPNPDYDGPLGTTPATIMRDLGFGAGGTVTLNGTALGGVTWGDTSITAPVPASLPDGAYQLAVTRSDGTTSVNAVTVTKGGSAAQTVSAGGSIQDAITAANPGDLILVGPGTYEELVIMSKPLRLQGAGADTIIVAAKRPAEKLQTWLDDVAGLFGNGVTGAVDPLPGQVDFTLATEQGAGITVLAKNSASAGWTSGNSRIDGFTITGADLGGGIYVNGYAHNLQISNNNITGNSGFAHGGVRIGQPFLPLEGGGPFALNTDVNIHHNSITLNGATSFESAGGGVSLNAGSDNYVVSENFICGNYTAGDGAGVGHLGLSDNGLIRFNKIVFNQSINNSFTQGGGGIAIAGEPVGPPALTLGAGDVTVDGNLIQGNQAASGHGGGLRAQLYNGVDVQLSNQSRNWHALTVTNNMIVNNVAGWSGAGISLQDTVNASIVLNTIANNDSTATVGGVLNAVGVSVPQPAGISSELNSLGLNGAIPGGSANKVFSNPTLTHNILWHNRAFSFDGTELQPVLDPVAAGDCVAGATYIDLGVLDPASDLNPRNNILTSTAGYHNSNFTVADPEFLSNYCNGGRSLSNPGPMLATAAFAEGGNFVDVRYGPLTLAWSTTDETNAAPWDYHLGTGSPAIDTGNNSGSNSPSVGGDHDIDSQARPYDYPGAGGNNTDYDLGADEVGAGSTEPPPPPPPPAEDTAVAFTSATLASLNGGVLEFGARNGTVSSDITIAVTGSGNVTFGDLAVSGSNRYELGNDTCSGATIGPNNVCTVTIDFIANGNTQRDGTLTVPHNAAVTANPLLLQLSGR